MNGFLSFFFFHAIFYMLISSDPLINECEFWLKKHLFNSTEHHYLNFSIPVIIFEDINDLTVKCKSRNYEANVIKCYAKRDILFENDLDLRSLVNLFKTNLPNELYTIQFQNTKGFNQKILKEAYEIYPNNYKLLFSGVFLSR